MATVLLVDDDQLYLDLHTFLLKRDRHDVLTALEPISALQMLQARVVDLAIVETGLKEHDGYRLCRQIQKLHPHTCLIIVSDNRDEEQVLRGLSTADDYMSKPVSPRHFLARVQSLLRRAQRPRELDRSDNSVIAGEIALNLSQMRAVVNGAEIALTPREVSLLHALMYQPDRVLSRQQLMRLAWGKEFMVTPKAVDVCVQRIRAKINPHLRGAERIRAVRGRGYRFEAFRTGGEIAGRRDQEAELLSISPSA